MSQAHLAIREEINQRLTILHQLLGLGSNFLMAAIVFGFLLYSLTGDLSLVQTFLLFIPIAVSCLTFNYQANQMTLEAVAKFTGSQLEGFGAWEQFYGARKGQYQLLSFLKVLPLLLPQLIPVVLLLLPLAPFSSLDQVLLSIDLGLFALVIFNFRYKWGK